MGTIMAIVINFTLIGIWHGPNWSFVLFGFLHGCYYIPLILKGKLNKKAAKADNRRPSFQAIKNMALTFLLVMFTFVIFRADSLSQAFGYYRRLFSASMFSAIQIAEKVNMAAALLAIVIMFTAEWFQQDQQHALQINAIKSSGLRYLIYFFVIGMILGFSPTTSADFIYFKF
jgi:alginate O-acetyltransferase complex protein AlgI